MKQSLLAFTLLLGSLMSYSQTKLLRDSWKITINKSQVVNISKEDKGGNAIVVNKKLTALAISYTEAKERKDWIRSIMIVDDNDKELFKKTITNNITLGNADLKKITTDSKTFHIYTISLPKDPKIAATVRVRRVHLCTLTVK